MTTRKPGRPPAATRKPDAPTASREQDAPAASREPDPPTASRELDALAASRKLDTRPDRRRLDTPERILDAAEQLVQTRGFNAFSYAQVAAQLGITTASLHYHFPGKAELGRALIARYAERFTRALEEIDRRPEASAAAKLAAYAGLYADALRGQGMCLCGMLAAEYETLPKPIVDAVVAFFDDNETWLEHVLDEGGADKSLRFDGSARDTARMILSGLEGAMLVVRPYGDADRFQAIAGTLLAGLSSAAR